MSDNFKAYDDLPKYLRDVLFRLNHLDNYAWRKADAIQVIEKLRKLRHSVVNIHVFALTEKGPVIPAHAVYDAEAPIANKSDEWISIVDISCNWATNFISYFEFLKEDSVFSCEPLFEFWAYCQKEYIERNLFK
jgi:hypothetical protein